VLNNVKVKRGVCGRPLEGGANHGQPQYGSHKCLHGKKKESNPKGEFMMGTIQCEMEMDRFTPSRMMGVGDHVP
jgi:hypothetical protein